MKLARKLFNLTFAAAGMLAQSASALITIETVPVGNAGNAADPTTGYGAVGYDYGIGKYEVTLNQYTEFLNAVAKTDSYGLYNMEMAGGPYFASIARSGVSGSYVYSVIGSGNRPVTYVSWYDSARFVNWLHNGQPVGLQTAGTTETGAYTLTGNTGIITRNSGWNYSLPSENEWYKAAYHQPAAQGGDTDNYWRYPTANNEFPNSRNGSLTDPNSGNFYRDDGIANGFNDGWAYYDGYGSYLKDVGAFNLAGSFYGTFDQGGNVWEWNDVILLATGGRGERGGNWGDFVYSLGADVRSGGLPSNEDIATGFRVAIWELDDGGPAHVPVPEPSVAGIMSFGIALLAWRRK